jgi:hypothetical protein
MIHYLKVLQATDLQLKALRAIDLEIESAASHWPSVESAECHQLKAMQATGLQTTLACVFPQVECVKAGVCVGVLLGGNEWPHACGDFIRTSIHHEYDSP